MDGQQTVSGLAERLGTRRDKNREHLKEHRLSKADIGGPITAPEKKVSRIEKKDMPESAGGLSMVLRGVIIQRDERGYGLTVSGDNPVYVQSVKENGAAYTAGVRQGDRIIKVNGTNVTEYNHIEVVKLIKSGYHVALTLLSPPVVQTDTSSAIPSIKRPHSAVINESLFYDEKVNMIKKMLEHERAEVEHIKEEYARNPDKKLLEELGGAQKLMQDLEKQLWKFTGKEDSSPFLPVESARQNQDIPIHQLHQDSSPGEPQTTSLSEMEGTVVEDKVAMDLGSKVDSEKQKDNTSVAQQYNIMTFEEEELTEESSAHPDHGPFQDFEKLKLRPAHTAVFLNYVFRSQDPCPLLLVLTVEQYRQLSSTKELMKFSELISKTYLAPTAPLKVAVDDGIAKSIVEATQSRSLSDDALRSVFDPAVQHALKTVRDNLQQFCQKREQGLSNCFGEEKISPNMDHSQEVKVVEEILTPLIQDLGQFQNGGDEAESWKSNAKVDALERFIVQWTGKRKSKITSRILGSMMRSTKPTPVLRPKNANSMDSIVDDNKRMSILVKLSGKKTKQKEGSSTASLVSSTVIPVVQSAHQEPYAGETGHVSNLVNRFQDYNSLNGSQAASEVADGGLAVFHKKERSGSFRSDRRQRSATGKSNSDPDANTVELALRGNMDNSFESQMSSFVSNSSVSSPSMTSSQTSASLSLAAADDLIHSLVAANPDLDVELESQWSQTTPREVKSQLDKKECKRQEVINELLYTEKHHVRDLVILHLLFYQQMQSDGGLTQEELSTVFPNLQEILAMHRKLKKALTDLKEKDGHVIKDITTVLFEMFNGIEGEKFKNECAKYCGNQTTALVFIKERCKKDQRFNTFIQTAEKHPICRRLQLKDFVPVEFQRLTKYPLLLENIIKNTKKKEEANRLRQVHKQCKDILGYVNKAVKDAEDYQKIVEIQKNLDSSALNKVDHPIAREYKNIDLTKRKLVHQGPLTWRITQTEKKKSVVLHCVLFEDCMVLLQKQEDRYVLKCHVGLNSAKDEKSSVQPPILKMSTVIGRNVATDKKAFYVMSMSEFGSQIYELVASTVHEMQEWLKIVVSTAEAAKEKETSLPHPRKDEETSLTHPRRDAFIVAETSRSNSRRELPPSPDRGESEGLEEEGLQQDYPDGLESMSILDKIHQKHEEISAALIFKHNLLATYAGIEPAELDNVLDMSLADSHPDPPTLALHLLSNCKKLTSMLNDTLSPDMDFLQVPGPPQVLLPIPEASVDKSLLNSSTETSTPILILPSPTFLNNNPTPGDKSQDDKFAEPPKNNWVDSESKATLSDSEDANLNSASVQVAIGDRSTPDRRSNASLELIISDYETASEPHSPSSVEDIPKMEHEIVSESGAPEIQEDQTTITIPEENEEVATFTEQESTSVTSPTDAGIGMTESNAEEEEEEESDNTLSAVDTIDDSLGKLVSPIAFDSDNLMDFGDHAISPSPQVSMMASPSTSQNTSGPMGRANPLDIRKMLEISHNLESQLLRLLQSVKDGAQEKQELVEKVAKLQTDKDDLEENKRKNEDERSELLSQIDRMKSDNDAALNDTTSSAKEVGSTSEQMTL